MKNQSPYTYSSNAKLEHLLRLDIIHTDDVPKLISLMSNYLWNCYDINLTYTGHADYDNGGVSELFFRSDRPVSQTALKEVLEIVIVENAGMVYGFGSKTMVCDEIEEVYEDFQQHYENYSVKDIYDYSDQDMIDIFGEDAEEYS